MRLATAFTVGCFALSAQASASPAPAEHMPARKAFDSVPGEPAPSCMAGGRLLSHAAYYPASASPLRCSALLSTDTLMKIRHWDHT